jgi:hypothetical protein
MGVNNAGAVATRSLAELREVSAPKEKCQWIVSDWLLIPLDWAQSSCR